jgi:alpha-ketoglutarate-dependent dioxygenase alkB family protein 2
MNVTTTDDYRILELKYCIYIPQAINYKDGYKELLNILAWQQERVVVYGKLHTLERKSCRYGCENSNGYSGIGVKRRPIKEWPDVLHNLVNLMNDITKEIHPSHSGYNFILCNYYADGKAYIGYHSDNESDYVEGACIGSLSFGASRDFSIKNIKNNKTHKILLNDGDVFIMEPGFQQKYKHSIPKRANVKGRINLTFRVFK